MISAVFVGSIGPTPLGVARAGRLVTSIPQSVSSGLVDSVDLLLAIGATGLLLGLVTGLSLAVLRRHSRRLRDRATLAIVVRAASAPDLPRAPVRPRSGSRARLVAVPPLDAAIVEFDGPLVFLGRGQILDVFAHGQAPENVVLDFHQVTVIDAGGAMALLDLVECLRVRGRKIRGAGATGRVAEALNRAGLVDHLEGQRMHRTVGKALEELLPSVAADEPPEPNDVTTGRSMDEVSTAAAIMSDGGSQVGG